MTSLSLLLWIVLGIVLQLMIFLGISFWRHWLGYQALNSSVLGLRSDDLRETDETAAGPRPDFRSFRVESKVIEDAAQSICSFYLVPEDGQPLPAFLPGQFLTFRLDVPVATGGNEQVIRCYSLSDAPRPNHYRVSIKRVPSPMASDVPPGRSSNYFHDQVASGSLLQVRAPSGHFHIDRSDAPVVLIAGGIGITPMLSMLNWSLSEQLGREVWLFYGVRNGRELVMKSQLEALAAEHPNFHLQLCFSNPLPEEVAGHDYQHRGRVDVDLLRVRLPLKPYHFYICGPTPMMESLVQALEDWGVPDAHIHFEAFGPGAEIEMGRVKGAHWGSRVIDLDLLLYDELRLQSTALTIPRVTVFCRRPRAEPIASTSPPICVLVVLPSERAGCELGGLSTRISARSASAAVVVT